VEDPQYKGLSYTDKTSTGPVLRDYTGNQLIRVPKTSFRVVPGLNLLDGKLRLQLAYEHEGARFVDTANSVRLPAYNVLSASARYDVSQAFSLYFYADNINNSLGLTEGNPRAGELQSADAGEHLHRPTGAGPRLPRRRHVSVLRDVAGRQTARPYRSA
jgi:outer membrane receptor protein involved in Fe transport